MGVVASFSFEHAPFFREKFVHFRGVLSHHSPLNMLPFQGKNSFIFGGCCRIILLLTCSLFQGKIRSFSVGVVASFSFEHAPFFREKFVHFRGVLSHHSPLNAPFSGEKSVHFRWVLSHHSPLNMLPFQGKNPFIFGGCCRIILL